MTQGSLCLTARASRNSHFVNVSVQVARIPLSSSLVSSVIQRVHTKEGLVCRPHTSSTNTAAPMYIHTAKWTSHRNVFATSFVSSVLFYCQLTLSRSLLFSFLSISCLTHTTSKGRACCIVLTQSRSSRASASCVTSCQCFHKLNCTIGGDSTWNCPPERCRLTVEYYNPQLHFVHMSPFSCRVLIHRRIFIFPFKTQLSV